MVTTANRLDDSLYLADVLILCVECQQPIKARINTQQWIRVEWIGPAGECQTCYAAKKESVKRMPTEAELVRDAF